MAGFFSTATLEQVRAASDIVDVIGAYLPLKRAGANFVALCPFHKEKTPSFNVHPHRQIFHCFGCHKGGDVFTFVREYENIDFPEAVRRLAERAKIPLEFEQNAGEQQARSVKEKLLQIHEQIAQRWQSALDNEASGQIARDYLAKRGVPAEARKLFRLGYAPEAWDDTVNWAKSKGHDLLLVEKAGLILSKNGGEHYYDRFRGRLMFPICDEQGRVIGFSGRVLSGDEKSAKYVNSPETPIFTKSKVFFGLDKSKRALLDVGCAVVCEGQLDLIACFMAGVQNVVAPQGTALTPDHIRILQRYVGEVVLCFDSDEAGQNAAMRSLDNLLASDMVKGAEASALPEVRSLQHLLASGLAVRVAIVPAPHDPDSFIKASGGDAFRKLIDGAEGFFDYYLNRLCTTNDVSTDKGRLAVLRAMAEAVHKTGNGVVIDRYARKTALRLGVAPESVPAEFRKMSRAGMSVSGVDELDGAEPGEGPAMGKLSAPERWLLRIMLTNDDLVSWVAERLDCKWLEHPAVRRVVEARLSAFRTNSWTGIPGFLDALSDEGACKLVTEAVADPGKAADPARTLKGDPAFTDNRGILEQLRDEFVDRQIAVLKRRISDPQTAEAEQFALVRQQQELRQQKRQPLGPVAGV